MAKFEILSLGGSLVCPDKIDTGFLKKFKNFILKQIKKGKKFVIFIGGGKIAREYQETAKKLLVKDRDQLDWMGILATWLNAFLVKSLFGNLAFPQVLTDPSKKIRTTKKIILFGGWKPGWSTDFDAVLAAKNFGAKRVINLSNIDYVYDKNPKKFKNAKPLKKISFNEFFKIIGKKWMPGANLPFDPVATKLAKKEKIKIIILNGKNFENLEKALKGEKFKGTIIDIEEEYL
jgi:uridylate kinase